MIHTPSAATATVRCVFFIDPKRTVRAMIYYPLNVGRNFNEIMRVVDALQVADKHGVAVRQLGAGTGCHHPAADDQRRG